MGKLDSSIHGWLLACNPGIQNIVNGPGYLLIIVLFNFPLTVPLVPGALLPGRETYCNADCVVQKKSPVRLRTGLLPTAD